MARGIRPRRRAPRIVSKNKLIPRLEKQFKSQDCFRILIIFTDKQTLYYGQLYGQVVRSSFGFFDLMFACLGINCAIQIVLVWEPRVELYPLRMSLPLFE